MDFDKPMHSETNDHRIIIKIFKILTSLSSHKCKWQLYLCIYYTFFVVEIPFHSILIHIKFSLSLQFNSWTKYLMLFQLMDRILQFFFFWLLLLNFLFFSLNSYGKHFTTASSTTKTYSKIKMGDNDKISHLSQHFLFVLKLNLCRQPEFTIWFSAQNMTVDCNNTNKGVNRFNLSMQRYNFDCSVCQRFDVVVSVDCRRSSKVIHSSSKSKSFIFSIA